MTILKEKDLPCVFVIVGQQYRYMFDELLRIWIYAPTMNVIEETCFFISSMLEVKHGI